ncbi:hypothetical protein RGQ29_028735 [Quercus rubra]|uniref:Uncharacterized protein n=1 Tax=Quercus rubra TaxID=3512 RepID=A0AAN7IMH3_QUERU|nr:hypothetical protein RGQ29_028735 [Quercus rubra]
MEPLPAPGPQGEERHDGPLGSWLWFLCCCGFFTSCCPFWVQPGPPPPL